MKASFIFQAIIVLCGSLFFSKLWACPMCQGRYDGEFKSFVPMDKNGKPVYWNQEEKKQENKEADKPTDDKKCPNEKDKKSCKDKQDPKTP